MDTVDNAITKPVHRLEVFTGAGRRRSFSDEDKARIVAEIVMSGDSVSGVARRHGLSPQQLFGWRYQFRKSQVGPSEADAVFADGGGGCLVDIANAQALSAGLSLGLERLRSRSRR